MGRPIPADTDQKLYIAVGIILDDAYADNLARETGFEHGFLVDEQIVSSSLENSPLSVTSVDEVRRAIASGLTETAQLNFQDAHYYVALIPLLDHNDEVIGFSGILLPVENLLEANRTALLVLIFCTLLVAIAASGLAGYFSKRLTTPLQDLTKAALKISQGDYNSPVSIPESPYEIACLAKAFETSRETILNAMRDLSRSNAWFETLIQSVIEGIVTIDDQGKVTSFDQGAEQITGWKVIEALDMPINQVFPLVEGGDDFMLQIPLSGGVQHVNVKTHNRDEVALAVTCAPLQSLVYSSFCKI